MFVSKFIAPRHYTTVKQWEWALYFQSTVHALWTTFGMYYAWYAEDLGRDGLTLAPTAGWFYVRSPLTSQLCLNSAAYMTQALIAEFVFAKVMFKGEYRLVGVMVAHHVCSCLCAIAIFWPAVHKQGGPAGGYGIVAAGIVTGQLCFLFVLC
jgi:hypothetical protein